MLTPIHSLVSEIKQKSLRISDQVFCRDGNWFMDEGRIEVSMSDEAIRKHHEALSRYWNQNKQVIAPKKPFDHLLINTREY
jgi:hypothetical protein